MIHWALVRDPLILETPLYHLLAWVHLGLLDILFIILKSPSNFLAMNVALNPNHVFFHKI